MSTPDKSLFKVWKSETGWELDALYGRISIGRWLWRHDNPLALCRKFTWRNVFAFECWAVTWKIQVVGDVTGRYYSEVFSAGIRLIIFGFKVRVSL